jgi:hypothetical protein
MNVGDDALALYEDERRTSSTTSTPENIGVGTRSSHFTNARRIALALSQRSAKPDLIASNRTGKRLEKLPALTSALRSVPTSYY